MIDCLRFYINFGFPLFPCHAHGPKAKAPLTPHGFKDASLDQQQVEAWHRQYPDCAWGVATSAERAVLDVDVHKGGLESLKKLVAEYGALPPTPRVLTGSGGYHFWFRCPAGTGCGKPYPGIDRKADGGYVIVPPSKILIPEHHGRAYAWEVRPWEIPIADAPAWLLSLKPERNANANDPWVVQEACADLLTHPGCDKSKGEKRTPTLCQLVGVHLARGDSRASIYAMAEAWANRCNPPLEDWKKHVDGLIAKEETKAGQMTPLNSSISVLPEPWREIINSAEAQGEAQAQGELIISFPAPAQSAGEFGGVIYKALSDELEAELHFLKKICV